MPSLKSDREFLVPIDFSESSVKAFRHALGLAAKEKAFLTLVNVVEEPVSFRVLDSLEVEHQRRQEHLKQLEQFAQREAGSQVDVRVLVCEGSPAEQISRVAAKHHAEMIIVGKHKHRGPGQWLHGHTASKIAKLSFRV